MVETVTALRVPAVAVERAAHARPDFCVIDAADLARFVPIAGIDPPDGDYTLIDVDTGFASRNMTPDAALAQIEAEGRSPLTVEEGLALLRQVPGSVAVNAGFSLAGSRCGDRRVMALWISRGKPKLGWCWAGNPHTWLGTASCAGRIVRYRSG
jgi:hypothetical protein